MAHQTVIGLVELEREVASEAATGEQARLDVSVLVLLCGRADPLNELYHEYSAAIARSGRSFEFIFVACAHCAAQVAPLHRLVRAGEPIRLLVAGPGASETALLRKGLPAARADTIITLPAYRQVEAQVLPTMLERLAQGADLVVARRWPRHDPAINRAQSRLLHLLLRGISNEQLHDVACGVRVARREVLESVPLYGDSVRFLPLIACHDDFNVIEVSAPQHQSDCGRRIYSPGIYVRRALDLLGLFFLFRFIEKPLRFFGLIGSLLAGTGSVILVVLLVNRLAGFAIGQRPVLLLGALLLMLGVQAIALGLVGELIVHYNLPARRIYRLAKKSDPPPR
jgi:hypothetical protein